MSMQSVRHGDVEIAYQVREATARTEAPTLLLIMGIDLRSAHWGEHFVSALARRYRVITFDNRGTGDSTKRVESISADLWARDALAVLDAVGAERVHVVGYSMGGRIAQELAVNHPERVERMLLLSSVVGGPEAVNPYPEAMAMMVPDPEMDPQEFRRRNLLTISGPGFGDDHPGRLDELLTISSEKRTHPSIVMKQVNVLRQHVVDRLPAVEAPTCIVHGDADSLVPFGNGEALHRLMPEAGFLRLPGVGHLPTWEAPEVLIDAIEGFFG